MRSICLSLLLAAVPLSSALTASAATLCVNQAGSQGCYAHIVDAIKAAQPMDTIYVQGGTYAESVTIPKSLTLVGFGATIEAKGLPRGIFVDGIDYPGLQSVHVHGFTVQDANFEGILVANASASSISNNTVLNNNRLANGVSCVGIDAWEPGEAQDCGEGIHLLGADHIIVTANTVTGNAGGMLISDDTGPVHHNLVSFNTVKNNPYACGITMASHPPATLTNSSKPLGVYNNTIYGNLSEANGFGIGGGAGIGIFDAVDNSSNQGNVVAANIVTGNGHPGIALHAHAPDQVLNDNTIVGNLSYANGAETGQVATPGPAGINVFSLSPATGNMISGNIIAGEQDDVVANLPSLLQVQFNDLLGPNLGVFSGGKNTIDATGNWWGDCSLAAIGGCSTSSGTGIWSQPSMPTPVVPLANLLSLF
ncbi:nitrous oxide reductase family maturation protein NosD [Acidipila sp. EB88]|uniref:right-handed parallel beta-helix repeat-containing protein n=1 Tax=Acidipila sp. EB88 TaxID=2305226 RepID=UPI00131583A0|nr:right-handed parallel beta-helix repeat-containing protein [Acidipila sp. EB88]